MQLLFYPVQTLKKPIYLFTHFSKKNKMEQKSTFWTSAMVYGLYLALVLTLFSVILYVSGLILNTKVSYASFVLVVAGIVIAQISYRNRELNGAITYSQALGFGVAIMFFAGIVSALYTLILYSIIDPGLIDQMKIMQEEALLQKGLSDDQIEATMVMTSKMMTPVWMSIMGLIGSVFSGTIVSLITSIFVKKQPNEDAFDEAMGEIKTDE
jgi:hypothetical protein